jgi:hypothetical protein
VAIAPRFSQPKKNWYIIGINSGRIPPDYYFGGFINDFHAVSIIFCIRKCINSALATPQKSAYEKIGGQPQGGPGRHIAAQNRSMRLAKVSVFLGSRFRVPGYRAARQVVRPSHR